MGQTKEARDNNQNKHSTYASAEWAHRVSKQDPDGCRKVLCEEICQIINSGYIVKINLLIFNKLLYIMIMNINMLWAVLLDHIRSDKDYNKLSEYSQLQVFKHLSISISLSYAHWWTISKKCRYACISLKSTCVKPSFDMVGKYYMVTVYKYGHKVW